MGLLHWNASGSDLRGHAETRIVPEATALFAFHAALDRDDLRDVDSHRASLRLGSRHRRPGTQDGSPNRHDGWVLRRRAQQLCTSSLVAYSPRLAARLDARPVGRRDPSGGSRGILIQGVTTALIR